MPHRLFVALALPRSVRDALIGQMGGIAGARWQRDDQLHCTVRFVGEVDGRQADDVVASLAGLRHPAITATIAGVGSFDRHGRVDALWRGIEPADALGTLHAKVDRALVRAGLAADARAYRPHITIARFGRAAAPPADIALGIPVPPRLLVRFDELRLYESRLGHDGADYEIVERYPLG